MRHEGRARPPPASEL